MLLALLVAALIVPAGAQTGDDRWANGVSEAAPFDPESCPPERTAALKRQWGAIGVRAVRVRLTDAADLKLIDEVAPSDQADWFLRHFLCDRGPPCSETADAAFIGAMSAATPAERSRMMRDAEERLIAITPFIPIAQPVRWSLAQPALPGFRTNSLGIHPLAALIDR